VRFVGVLKDKISEIVVNYKCRWEKGSLKSESDAVPPNCMTKSRLAEATIVDQNNP